MILGTVPTWRTILFYAFIYIFHCLHVSSTSCSSSGETNCVNTTSGSCRWLCRVQVVPTCTRHSHRHRVTATRGCIDTICLSWWWARCARNMYRVKNINKYIEENCASRGPFEWRHSERNDGWNNTIFWQVTLFNLLDTAAFKQTCCPSLLSWMLLQTSYSETSVFICRSAWCHIPEDNYCYIHHC